MVAGYAIGKRSTWTYSRRFVLVAATWSSSSTARVGRFYVQVAVPMRLPDAGRLYPKRPAKIIRLPTVPRWALQIQQDFPGVISYKPVRCQLRIGRPIRELLLLVSNRDVESGLLGAKRFFPRSNGAAVGTVHCGLRELGIEPCFSSPKAPFQLSSLNQTRAESIQGANKRHVPSGEIALQVFRMVRVVESCFA